MTGLKRTPAWSPPLTGIGFAVQREVKPHHIFRGIVAELHGVPVGPDNDPRRVFGGSLAFAMAIPALTSPAISAAVTGLSSLAVPLTGRAGFGESYTSVGPGKLSGLLARGCA